MYTDGTTEPIIAIIGHPIAGNPSQLAIERSLHSLGLEWRVLSFDVAPEDVAKALDGFSVTGIAGVMIAKGVQRAAATWYAEYCESSDLPGEDLDPGNGAETDSEKDPDTVGVKDNKLVSSRINCLHRNEQLRFLGSDQQIAYLEAQLGDRCISQALWLGEMPGEDQRDCWPSAWGLFSGRVPSIDVDAELIAAADLIVLADGKDCDIDEWPADDGTTVVIDLAGGEEVGACLKTMGYAVISCIDLQVGTLAGCIGQWTGQQAPPETISEAIEEYFGV